MVMDIPIEEFESRIAKSFKEKRRQNRLNSIAYLLYAEDVEYMHDNLLKWYSVYVSDIVKSYIQNEIDIDRAADDILRRFDAYLLGFRPSGGNIVFISSGHFLLNESDENNEYEISLKCNFSTVYPH